MQESNGGELSLEHLRHASTLEAKATLQSLKGLGPKSVACILAFTLDREDLAVDTHGTVYGACLRKNNPREWSVPLADAPGVG